MNFIFKHKFILAIAVSVLICGGVFAQEQKQPPSPKVSLDVKGMDVVDVLKILSSEGGFNLSIGGDVKGRITLFLKDIDVWEALEIVFAAGNLAYEQKGEIIYVMSEREYEINYGRKYWDKRKVRVFSLKHASPGRLTQMLSQVISKIGKVIVDEPTNTLVVIDIPENIEEVEKIIVTVDKLVETKVFSLNYLPVKEVEESLKASVTKDVGSLKTDATSNKVIVTDYPAKLKEIEKIITAFDEKPLQVLIDAKIIEIQPFDKFDTGIDWDYWMEKYFRVAGSFTIPTTSTNTFSLGTIGVGTMAGKNDYSGILKFLQSFGETRILSSPRILTLNNQEAKILVGTKDAYITSSVSEVGQEAVTSQEVNYVDVGVKLYVTPTINRKGYITLKIKPEVSSSERKEIKTEDKITEIPIVTTSEAETSVIVKDGVSIIMGGLRKTTHNKERTQVPVLGSIPVLGLLFRSEKSEVVKSELVILITPRIISGDRSIEAELGDKAKGDMNESEALKLFREEFKRKDSAGIAAKEEIGVSQPLDIPQKENKQESVKEVKQDAKEEVKQEIKQEVKKPVKIEKVKEIKEESPREKKEVLKAKKEIVKEEAAEIAADDKYSYYLRIVEKIRKASLLVKMKKKGEVRVSFVISKNGILINDPVIISSTDNGDLIEGAKDIIKKASPFSPFPPAINKEKEIFEVTLVF
ncbi:MAG: secretin N-terminal domain-containing protein [Candidatus Omnitrophota bacterium]